MARYFGNVEEHAPGGREEQFQKLIGDEHLTPSPSSSVFMTAVGRQLENTPYKYEAAQISGTYYKDWYDMSPSPGWYGETGTLFTHRPSHVYVSGAYAHPNLRYTIPVMFSHMHRLLGAQFKPDHSLSEHGAALANKAKKLGLPIYLDPEEYRNDDEVGSTFLMGDELDSNYMIAENNEIPWNLEVPQSEIAKSKKHYRNVRQAARDKQTQDPKNKASNPNFEQLQLDYQ
jgi:hypothetical protein